PAASKSVGALALGYYENGKLNYAGRVGTGWSAEQARSLHDELENIAARMPPLAKLPPAGAEKGVRWVQPRRVCEIEYRDWTRDRLLRASVFKGLRDDRPAEDIVLEEPPTRAPAPAPAEGLGVRLTHPERILWDAGGITKQGLAEFYADIAEWILPYIARRP